MLRFALLLAAVPVVSTGCLAPADFDAMDDAGDRLRSAEQPVVLGELPVVGAFDRDADTEVDTVDDVFGVRVDGELDDWVMLGGEIELDVAALPTDEWTVVGPRDHWLYACTGPQRSTVFWEYDVDVVHIRPTDDWLDVVTSVGRGRVLAARVPLVGEDEDSRW